MEAERHLPITPILPTWKELIPLTAKELGVAGKYRVLNPPVLRMAGRFSPSIPESYEMIYQSDSTYLFDSSKYASEFGFGGDGLSRKRPRNSLMVQADFFNLTAKL